MSEEVDHKGPFHPAGDWQRAKELERRLEQGERLTLDEEIRDLLRAIGADVGLAPELVVERLQSLDGAERLLREARARIRDGSHALTRAMNQAWDKARGGSPDEGCAVLEEFERTAEVAWYSECARREAHGTLRW